MYLPDVDQSDEIWVTSSSCGLQICLSTSPVCGTASRQSPEGRWVSEVQRTPLPVWVHSSSVWISSKYIKKMQQNYRILYHPLIRLITLMVARAFFIFLSLFLPFLVTCLATMYVLITLASSCTIIRRANAQPRSKPGSQLSLQVYYQK